MLHTHLPASASVTSARFDCLEKWLSWQQRLHAKAIALGLERCRQVADNMGLLTPDYTVISVAGTNGKGSSVTMLDQILRAGGYKTGRYTSPHLIRYNERICVAGEPASDKALCDAFNRIDRARGDISLTYFEFGTLAALDIFRQQGIELAILEVGLGGRLDAVNILAADVALICAIDLDHQEWLGHDRETIAREKAGIFRHKKAAVCSDPKPPHSLLRHAEQLEVPLAISNRDYHYTSKDNTWSFYTSDTRLVELPRPMQYCDFQLQNAAGVLMVLEHIKQRYPVSHANICTGLNNFRLAGRMQIIPGEIQKILDVAHNAKAIEVLVNNLKIIPCIGKTHLLIGMLKTKDHPTILKLLSEVADSWNIIKPTQDGLSMAPEQLAAILNQLGSYHHVHTFATVEAVFEQLQQTATAGDRIVVTGSFFTVAAALRYLV